MFNKKTALGLALSLASANAMAITVTTSNDANALANSIIGAGITISNATYSGTDQSGTFTGDSVFGMGKGLVLTTGSATTAGDELNTSDSTSINTSSPGDAQLSALIGGTTNDSAVLEFDFTTTGGDLFFNFVFASEEYNEFVNSSFNDVFAFFVDGVNIALAPDGQVASINSINCGNPFNAAQVGDNCSSYNNNDLSDGGPFFATEYDGFTDVLTASALGLGAGTHSIKIAIADTGDSAYDSAVFIQGDSFSDTPPVPTPAPGILSLLALGLLGVAAKGRRKAA